MSRFANGVSREVPAWASENAGLSDQICSRYFEAERLRIADDMCDLPGDSRGTR